MEYTYEWYTIPKPFELPDLINNLMSNISGHSPSDPNRINAQNTLNDILKPIGEFVLEKTIRHENTTGIANRYGYYVCITKHLCSCFTIIGSGGSGNIIEEPIKMYFTDVKLKQENEDDNIIIKITHLNTYKMNTGNLPGFIFKWNFGETIGIQILGTSRKPLFGISQKKILVPEHSYFIEGSHQELYDYPFHFFNSENEFVDGIPNENYITNGLYSKNFSI